MRKSDTSNNLSGTDDISGGGRQSEGVPRWAWVPIPLFLLALILLRVVGIPVIAEPPYLVVILNFVFSTAVLLFVAYLAAGSFARQPSLPVLLLGCGTLCFGVVSLVAGIAIHFQQENLALTVYNKLGLDGLQHGYARGGVVSCDGCGCRGFAR